MKIPANRANILQEQIVAGEKAKKDLEELRLRCSHTWGESSYDPIVREAYADPGDPPGTMGVDWRGPTYVPREEKARWSHKCRVCGKVEYTFETKVVKTEPVWR